MGQLFSRQPSPSRPRFEKDPLATRGHHSRHERTSHMKPGDGQKLPKSVHWDRSSTRVGKASVAQGSRPRSNALREVDGNIGIPKRRPKYGRGKTSPESIRRRDTGHQQIRKPDVQQAKAKTKDRHYSKPQTSTSGLHRKHSRQIKECVVCTDTRSLHRFPDRPPTAACTHESDVCRRCLRTWIQSEFSTKVWNEINCPICAARLQYADIQDFAPEEVFRRYDKLTIKAHYDSIPNYTWCIARKCKSGQVHAPGTARFRCKSCRKSHCVVHGVEWHKGETCGEYDYRTNKHIKKEEEKASKKLMEETTKRCPGCRRSIEKSFGCDHMTCSKCKHEFCWQCLAPYAKKGLRRVIHRQGCEYHNPEWDEG